MKISVEDIAWSYTLPPQMSTLTMYNAVDSSMNFPVTLRQQVCLKAFQCLNKCIPCSNV